MLVMVDNERFVWGGQLSKLQLVFLLLAALAAGCGRREDRPELPVGPIPGETIHVVSTKEAFLFDYMGSAELAIHWSGGRAACEINGQVRQAWDVVRAVSSEFDPEFREKVYLDPNISPLLLVVAFARERTDGQFEIRQVRGEEAMLRVSQSLQMILDGCGLELDIGAVVFEYSK